jgi:hypothetical protein
MKKVAPFIIAAIGSMAFSAASAQTGPVADACKDDIAKYCADKSHGSGEVRTCLEEQKDKVSAECKTALETTGGGHGRHRQ